MTAAASQVHGSPSRPGRPAIGLPLPLRIDARRPASWIALAMAAVGGGAAGELDSGQQAVAWMIGTLATVAAIGDLPLTLCDGGIARMRGRRLAWLCARAAWPIAGLIAAAAWAGWAAGVRHAVGPLAAGLMAVVVAAATVHAGRLLDVHAADAASLAVAGGCASAFAVCWLGGRLSSGASLAAVGITWAAAGLAAAAWSRRGEAFAWTFEGSQRDAARPGILPAQGPLRRLLVRLSMLSSLAGMVAWLFLDPARAELYPLLAFAWFVSLAVPRAALLDGIGSAAAWNRLLHSAAGGTAGRILPGALRRPGPERFAAESALSCAAILGWPPLVAAALGAGSSARGWPFVAMAASLAAAAVLLTAVATAAAAFETSGETLQAILLAAAAVGMEIGASNDARLRPFSPPAGAPSPSQPFLPDRHSHGPVGQPDVEQTIASCQTAQGSQFLPVIAAAGELRFSSSWRRESGGLGTIQEMQVATVVRAPPSFQGVFPCTDKK